MSARSLNKPLVSDIFSEDQLLRVLPLSIAYGYSLKLKVMLKEVQNVR